ECDCFGRLCHSSGPPRVLVGDRVDPIKPQLARLSRPLSRLGEVKGVAGAEAHVPQAAGGDITENPLFRSALGNAQIQTAASAIHGAAFRFSNFESAEAIECPCYLPTAITSPKVCPYSQGQHWRQQRNAHCC